MKTLIQSIMLAYLTVLVSSIKRRLLKLLWAATIKLHQLGREAPAYGHLQIILKSG